MKQAVSVFGPAILAAALLSACGGGGDAGAGGVELHGIAVGEPAASAPVARDAFIKMASQPGCNDIRNRLYVIDDKQVFWDVAGNCADAAYSRTLYGPQPQLRLCSSGDSIAGPRTSCDDERYRDMFDTILKHLAQADLGLGAAHKVELLASTGAGADAAAAMVFQPLLEEQDSGMAEAQNVVVRDAKAWETLWTQVNSKRGESAPPLPPVDFAKQMVVGVFTGTQPSGCNELHIARGLIVDGAAHVEYRQNQLQTLVACAPSNPASLALLPRVEGKVVFEEIKPSYRTYSRIDIALNWDVPAGPYTAVLKDEAGLQAMWAKHALPGTPVPRVDFGKSMLIFAYGGQFSSGCHSTQVTSYYGSAGKLYVELLDRTPGPTVMCTQSFIATGDLIEVERSDDPVVFAERTLPL